MACEFCTEVIALDQPCCELLCRHKVHTECFIRNAVLEDTCHMRCPNCREFVTPRQMIQDAEAVNGQEGQNDAIRYFWEHEPHFKAGLEALRDAQLNAKRAGAALAKKGKDIYVKLEAEIEPFVGQIKQKISAAKGEFKALPEQKEMARAEKSYNLKSAAFYRRWDVRRWQIAQALHEHAGARTLVTGLTTWIGYRRRIGVHQFNVRIS